MKELRNEVKGVRWTERNESKLPTTFVSSEKIKSNYACNLDDKKTKVFLTSRTVLQTVLNVFKTCRDKLFC